MIEACITAYEVWKRLEKAFKQTGSVALKARFSTMLVITLNAHGGDIVKYASKFRKTVTAVKRMNSGINLDENLLIHLFRCGLSFEHDLYQNK